MTVIFKATHPLATAAGESDEVDAVGAEVTVGEGEAMSKTNPKSKYAKASDQSNPIVTRGN